MNKKSCLALSATCGIAVRARSAMAEKSLSTRVSSVLAALVLGWSGSLLAAGPAPNQLPSGGQIVGGAGSVASHGTTMTVTQTTQRMIANWQTFDIGANAQVNFVQPSASAMALNRVLDQNPTTILGQLTANGQVMLVNPAGIVFGQGGQVNTAGLVASTLALSDEHFMAGQYHFTRDASGLAGNINNQGTIVTANGGVVALISPVVQNSGVIQTPSGSTLLVAGDAVDIDFSGDGLINYRVNTGTAHALLENSGTINADGGMAVLSAHAADAVTQAVVNNTGVVQAKSLQNVNGRIVLESDLATNSGTLDAGSSLTVTTQGALVNTGTLQAGNGTTGGQITANVNTLIDAGTWAVNGSERGGTIQIQAAGGIEQTAAGRMTADGGTGGGLRLTAGQSQYLSGTLSARGNTGAGGEIAVTAPETILAGAQVQADGATGGGRIRIGGGWQGQDADLPNATTTTVTASSTLTANATGHGNGGTVVLWSEQATAFAGNIEAKGGAKDGNGGQVEVSSHELLTFGGQVATAAPHGQDGSLLLDPRNITIDASGGGSAPAYPVACQFGELMLACRHGPTWLSDNAS
ncbi:MAG: filamentous hemagglutinin N-terminal domain-containing protein [Magnetococcales bacterium]|nr:filamentous hemagglutinin N-terminal domain-containing protein [Magnetococcales bacterium]